MKEFKSETDKLGHLIIQNKKDFNAQPPANPPRKWSDTPSWLNENDVRSDLGYKKTDSYTKPLQIPWADKAISKFRITASTESPIKEWWKEEDRKKNLGLENEIDINLIKAALKGVKNEWFNIATQNRKQLEESVNCKNIDWKKIMELKK